jgi:signal peptidase I
MDRIVNTQAYLDMVRDLLAEGKTAVPVPVKGVSMRPFLRDGDRVFLDLPGDRVRPGDIVLYTRPNGQYVLHRIYRVNKNGSFWIIGDSQLTPEPIIGMSCVHAKVSFVIAGDKMIKPGDLRWWFYACPWRWLAPWRRHISRIWEFFRRKR